LSFEFFAQGYAVIRIGETPIRIGEPDFVVQIPQNTGGLQPRAGPAGR
jgi:hypothetical protein